MSEGSQEQQQSMTSDSSFVILGQGSLQSDLSFMSNGFVTKYEQSSQPKNTSITTGIDIVNESSKVSGNHSSWSCDSHSQDIQARLDQLLKENHHLKETLNQNNLAMKTQFETLVMWQNEVFKTHQNHKQKFSETRDLVLKLRNENALLKKQIEESKTPVLSAKPVSMDAEQENTSMKRKIDELQQKLLLQSKSETPSKKEQELHSLVDNLLQKLEISERNCRQLGITNENIVIQKNKLEEKCKKGEQDILKISKNLEEALVLNNELRRSNEESQRLYREALQSGRKDSMPSLLPNSEARAQISNLFRQLEEERSKVSKLKDELSLERSTKVVDSKQTASSQLSECIDKLDDLDLSFDKQEERFSSMTSWLCLAEENMKARRSSPETDNEGRMRAEIAMLRNHLLHEQTSCQEKKECLQQMQIQFEKLLKEYEQLQREWKKFEESGQIQKYEDEVKSLAAQLKAKDELLTRKERQCDALKEEIKKCQLECEEIGILRAQVDLYQTDFNAEREAREKLAGEKEDLTQQVRQMQKRVQDLERQMLTRNSNSFTNSPRTGFPPSALTTQIQSQDSQSPSSNGSRSGAAARNSNGAAIAEAVQVLEAEAVPNTSDSTAPSAPEAPKPKEGEAPPKPYSCFKCETSFRELRQLQEHVEECLELTN